MMEKKAWLDKLYYDIGKQQYDFFLCGLYPDYSTKWKRYSECVFPIDIDSSCDNWKDKKFFEQINQRQILPNEIVIDLEEKESLPNTIKDLKKLNVIFKAFKTGSKGFHVHIFYNKKLGENEKKSIVKFYKGDIQKCSDKTMISLEYFPHWKSKELKTEVYSYGFN